MANTRVIALKHYVTGVLEHPPRRGTWFEAGDLAYIIGPNDELIGVLRTVTDDRTHAATEYPVQPGDQCVARR